MIPRSALVLFALLVPYGQEEEPEATPLPGEVAVPAHLADAFAHRAPDESPTELASGALGPWQTEVKHFFEERLADAEPEVPAALAGVRCNALRSTEPTASAVVGARIERGAFTGDEALDRDLAAELTALADAFEPGDFHAKFKTIGVRLDAEDPRGTAEFDLRFEAAGRDADGPLQLVAYWTVTYETAEPPRARSVRATRFESVRVAERPLFEDVTASAFVHAASFTEQLLPSLDHWTARVDQNVGMSLLGHEGLALGDVNGDGLEDLYVLQPGGLPNRLYLHEPDHTLRDVSEGSGLDWLDPSRSALILDLDGDGDRDVAAVVSEELLLLSNEGGWDTEEGGRFALRAVLPGLSFFSLSAADFDRDGDLDLYGCAYSLPYWEDSIPIPYHDANNGRPNSLYRNDGDWSFTDATAAVGLDRNNSRYSFAAAWEDYDRDGDPDLYVANDFGRNNLYRNDDGRFTDVAAEAGVEDVSAGMGVDWADVDGDGWPDLLVSNMFSSAGGRIAYQRRFHEEADEETRALYRRHARGNSLFRSRGDGTFEDATEDAGVGMGRWAWGSLFGDWNGDGAQDVFVPNGFVTNTDPDDL